MSNDLVLLYVTMPDKSAAKNLATKIIEAKLATCVNILPAGLSLYQWEGQIEEEEEIYMLVKTGKNKAMATRDFILSHHPYEVPCVLGLPIDETISAQPYIGWLKTSLK